MGGVWAVVAAAGSGARMGEEKNKVLLPLGGVPVVARTIAAFQKCGTIDSIAVCCAVRDLDEMREVVRTYAFDKVALFVHGGSTRQQSVYNALKSLPEDAQAVLIHDGARPFIQPEDIERCVHATLETGACVLGRAVIDTVKETEGSVISRTLDRSKLFAAQTPQGFLYAEILRAHELALRDGIEATDDAALVEKMGRPVSVLYGSSSNMKLTNKEDFRQAQLLLAGEPVQRTGMGYDAHRLAEGRELILCGVKIPHEKGLLGHSDADVAVHALIDSLLGAAALGDIGAHFPDSDERYRGIDSMKLLAETVSLLRGEGYALINCDLTIAAQKPKLAPYKDDMRRLLADTLGCDLSRVSVKAKTTEGMGFEGRGEGISCYAVAAVKKLF